MLYLFSESGAVVRSSFRSEGPQARYNGTYVPYIYISEDLVLLTLIISEVLGKIRNSSLI